MLGIFRKQIILLLLISSLFTVEVSAAQKKLTKVQLDAFMGIITNYIILGEPDKTAPVFMTPSSITAAENQVYAYKVRVKDANSVSFRLTGGDSGYFKINATTGVINFRQAPDFESRDTYAFTVIATDIYGNSSSQSVTIHIKNMPEIGKPKKTGQVISYRTYDDGHYQKGITPSYTRDEATGVVTDHITGFQWQDNVLVKKSYRDASYYCSELHLDGGGWRIPTIQELLTITPKGNYNPAIDTTVFQHYVNGTGFYDWYWSRTQSQYYSSKKFRVRGHTGEVSYDNDSSYIRCVR